MILALLGILSVFAVGIVLWTVCVEPRSFRVREFKVTVKKHLSRTYRILHLSDIHFSGPNKPMARFFDKLAENEYDFIFLTGDIFDSIEGLKPAAENLPKLKSKFGFFAVLGNHDYHDYHLEDVLTLATGRHPETLQPVDKFIETLKEAGVCPLFNETVGVPADKHDIFLIHGLDDPTTGRADFQAVLKNTDKTSVNVLLTHTIDALIHMPEKCMEVSFSGHSHGGQVRMPVYGALLTHTRLGRAYASGLSEFKGAKCVVSRGVGTSRFFQARFLCFPEAVEVEISGS